MMKNVINLLLNLVWHKGSKEAEPSANQSQICLDVQLVAKAGQQLFQKLGDWRRICKPFIDIYTILKTVKNVF